MLRWNTTRGGGPYYVRVTSPDPDLPFSMVAVAPPVYLQVPADPKAWPTGAREHTELSTSAGSAVPIDLGFAFPFFGLVYDRIWVSSAGYLAFERPPETEGFVGLNAVHSAVAVAAGEYDLTHPGATLAISRFGARELEVAWHAPLFGSSKFTDVALWLSMDTIVVRWQRIVLDGGGSLHQRLLSHLVCDELPVLGDPAWVFSPDTPALMVGAGSRGSIVRTADGGINTTCSCFYGADKGEGLDLAGEFVYALNIGGQDAVQVGDALFTSVQGAPGVQMKTDQMSGPYYGSVVFGSGNMVSAEAGGHQDPLGVSIPCTNEDDVNLVNVLGTCMYLGEGVMCGAGSLCGDLTLTIDLPVIAGESYRLQLLFFCGGGCPPTNQHDVIVDGVPIATDFSYQDLNGGGIHGDFVSTSKIDGSHGVFLRHDLLAHSSTVTVELDRSAYPQDASAFWINGLTMEHMTWVPPTEVFKQLGGAALSLVNDAYVSLPPMVLGGSVSVSQWVRLGTIFDGAEGITLFNSFQGTTCGDSDACRNAVGSNLDRHGWLALGNDVAAKRPTDLWAAGVIFDHSTASLFWEDARNEWLMVTFVVSEQAMHVYTGGQLSGVLVLSRLYFREWCARATMSRRVTALHSSPRPVASAWPSPTSGCTTAVSPRPRSGLSSLSPQAST
jgi:hypothetical protein